MYSLVPADVADREGCDVRRPSKGREGIRMNGKKYGIIVALLAMVVVAGLLFCNEWSLGVGSNILTDETNLHDQFQFGKNLDIWFMTMMIAFLMIFIRKFEWGVCLAVLLSAASSFAVYLGIQDFIFDEGLWSQALLIRGAICAITLVIAIGVFLGTVKMWQYLLIGVGFAFVYALVEWMMGNIEIFGAFSDDPGGSILVHMCAAYFGFGVALGIWDKRAFDEPMYTTTHSVSFVWLGSMLLWMLWPSFVTALVDPEMVTWGTITCFMAGTGSIISTYLLCVFLQGKVNPLVYAYAMLAGLVSIGAPLLMVGPWGALLIGLVAGVISTLSFIYLQQWLATKMGVVDVMGVHNLHGMGGWFGAIVAAVIMGSVVNVVMAVIVVIVTLVTGAVIGLICRFTRGQMDEICSDEPDFITNEAPKENSVEA